jgi:UDP-N-acetylglucosamine 2-epimerase
MKAARMARGGSPYGNGRAAVRILDIVRNYFSGAAA